MNMIKSSEQYGANQIKPHVIPAKKQENPDVYKALVSIGFTNYIE